MEVRHIAVSETTLHYLISYLEAYLLTYQENAAGRRFGLGTGSELHHLRMRYNRAYRAWIVTAQPKSRDRATYFLFINCLLKRPDLADTLILASSSRTLTLAVMASDAIKIVN